MSDSNFIGQSKLTFKEGELVYRKGDMAQQMYVILSGKIRMYVGTEPQGDWSEEMGKGDFFGEGSLLEPIPRHHTVVALEDTEVSADRIKWIALLALWKLNGAGDVLWLEDLVRGGDLGDEDDGGGWRPTLH